MTETDSFFAPYGAVTENELAMERAGLSPSTTAVCYIGGKAIGFSSQEAALRAFAATTPTAPEAVVVPLPRQPESADVLHEVA